MAVSVSVSLRRITLPLLAITLAGWLWTGAAAVPPRPGRPPHPQVPRPREFPAAAAGEYLAGELVISDPINRRGSLRLDGDGFEGKYDKGVILPFALLPYGEVWYQGAPADLCDIPFGTHLHGLFYLPPAGEEKTLKAPDCPPQDVPKQNHALLLEDDLSFHARRGRAWKIGTITLDPAGSGTLGATVVGAGTAVAGLPENGTFTVPQQLTIDRSTRLWRGRESIGWEDLAAADAWQAVADGKREFTPADLVVQLALAWHDKWHQLFFHVSDIWLDEESRQVAAERQRQRHIRRERHYRLPGWVDHVDHQRNIVTITLFGGRDRSLFDALRAMPHPGGGVAVEPATKTLRTWADFTAPRPAPGSVIDLKELPDPPVGSGGLQLRVKVGELLEGFRPGRIVRVAPDSFGNPWLPPEWRARSLDD